MTTRTWIRIILVSSLVLLLLGLPAGASGTAQENTPSGAGRMNGTVPNADLQPGDLSRSSPVSPGEITADAGSLSVTQTAVSGPSVSGVPIFPVDHI